MRQSILAGVILAFSLTLPTQAQQKPGNCAIVSELTADTVTRDSRTDGPDQAKTLASLKLYTKAQSDLADAAMAASYEQAKAFGWDKAKVDAMIEANEAALRDGFHTPTMDKDKVYMDHVMALNNCVQGAKSEAELGQSVASIRETLQTLQAWAQS